MMNTQGKVENTPATEFSVLMSVYHGDIPQQLDAAIGSILNQTLRPSEIVLVKDGPLTDPLDRIIQTWRAKYPGLFAIVELETNDGLGIALQKGIIRCSSEIVARMDADDISLPMRFERQLSFLVANPTVDVVSSWAAAFEGDPDHIRFIRKGPARHVEIGRLSRFRFPMIHAASMYRRAAVLGAGGYHGWLGFEDYDLWARMLLNSSRMAVIPEVLYKMRWGPEYVSRRHGFRRARMQIALQFHFLEMGFVTIPQFVRNVVIRAGSCFLPKGVLLRVRMVFGI